MIRFIYSLILLCSCQFVFAQTTDTSNNYVGKPGYFIKHYPNGSIHHEGIVKRGNKKGTLYYYFESGILFKKVDYQLLDFREGNYLDAKFIEVVTEYYESGNIFEVRKYINGGLQPAQEGWYANGQRKNETIYHEDGIHETVIYYYANGNMRYRAVQFKNKRRPEQDGLEEGWNEQGVKLVEYNYRNKLKHGDYKNWNENGNLIQHLVYDNDTSVFRKTWNDEGELISYADDKTSVESHFYKIYDKKTGLISSSATYKVYYVDEDSVVMRFVKLYDKEGEYVETKVHNQSLKYSSVATSVNGVVEGDKIQTQLFLFERRTINPRTRHYRLNYFNRPLEMGFWIDYHLSFPMDEDTDAHEKMILDELKTARKKVESQDLNSEYEVDPENFEKAAAYYFTFPHHMLFDTTIITSSLNEDNSGKYSFVYSGTNMHYEGALLDGLEHGESILYLNDSTPLFKRNYRHGMKHGICREYFLTGQLALEENYWMGDLLESKSFFLTGGIAKHERLGKRGQNRIKDEWDADKQPIAMFWEEDSLLCSIRLNEDRTLNSYTWNNQKEGVVISHTVYNGSDFMTVNIPPTPNREVPFKLSRHGVTVEGKAYWDAEKRKAVLEDDFGKIEKADPNEISFSETLPCGCTDWIDHKFWAAPTANYATLDDFKKYQHDFHAPSEALTHLFGHPYYLSGQEPDKYEFGKVYHINANFFSARPIDLFLPDTSGIIFTYEPCKSKYAYIKLNASLSFKVGSPKETKISISNPKTLALTIPAPMLVQVNNNFKPILGQDGKLIPGVFLFNADEVKYNHRKQLDVIQAKLQCAKPMQIGNSGMVLQINDLWPDFSKTWNYDIMTEQLSNNERALKLGLKSAPKNDFIGAFATSGNIYFPYSSGSNGSLDKYLSFRIENVLVSVTECRATVYAGVVGENETVLLSTHLGEELSITKTELIKVLESANLKAYDLMFEPGKELKLHLNYQL